jgi:hypothetical protein
MIVHVLQQQPPRELATALERFEQQFTYPLGPGRRFRILHGADYPRFFRAIGEAGCHVAERDGEVLGTIGAARRYLRSPHGKLPAVVYLGDLKVSHQGRGGGTLTRLSRSVHDWGKSRAEGAYGVVMDGTKVTPHQYTGRLGIPPFVELGKISVLRLATAQFANESSDRWIIDGPGGWACYLRLSEGRFASLGGNPAERSLIEPVWLMEPGGGACGRLEDTRRAKRLFADDGSEMLSGHLSCFAYDAIPPGAELLRRALAHAGRLGCPALFVAVPRDDADAIVSQLGACDIVTAPATVYGTGLESGFLWNINTAEI